jgi:hypothetical protein
MALSWSGRRQILYSAVAALVALVLLVVLWEALFAAAPTCFDQKQDGDEAGIDCGGSCSLLCTNQAAPPHVVWARSFEVSPGVYNAVAYIQNLNVGAQAGAHKVRYSFGLRDDRNVLVKQQDGVVDIPPVSVVPIVATGIYVGNRSVSKTDFNFDENQNLAWTKIQNPPPLLRVAQVVANADYSRLSATIPNDSVKDLYNVTVVTILYDAQNTAVAVSKSTIPLLRRRSSEQVTFTWPQGVPNVTRYEITVLPSF